MTAQVPASQEQGLGYHKAEPLIMDLGNVHFRFDDAALTKEGKTRLDQNIQVLMDEPDVEIVIGGHTSASGTKDHNQALSEKGHHLFGITLLMSERFNPIGFLSSVMGQQNL